MAGCRRPWCDQTRSCYTSSPVSVDGLISRALANRCALPVLPELVPLIFLAPSATRQLGVDSLADVRATGALPSLASIMSARWPLRIQDSICEKKRA